MSARRNHPSLFARGLGPQSFDYHRKPKRHSKVLKDNIKGITKPAIRRLARRGGVVRMSSDIYDEIRAAIRARLIEILSRIAHILEYRERKTVTTHDVVFVLSKMGNPIYGFGTPFEKPAW